VSVSTGAAEAFEEVHQETDAEKNSPDIEKKSRGEGRTPSDKRVHAGRLDRGKGREKH